MESSQLTKYCKLQQFISHLARTSEYNSLAVWEVKCSPALTTSGEFLPKAWRIFVCSAWGYLWGTRCSWCPGRLSPCTPPRTVWRRALSSYLAFRSSSSVRSLHYSFNFLDSSLFDMTTQLSLGKLSKLKSGVGTFLKWVDPPPLKST